MAWEEATAAAKRELESAAAADGAAGAEAAGREDATAAAVKAWEASTDAASVAKLIISQGERWTYPAAEAVKRRGGGRLREKR